METLAPEKLSEVEKLLSGIKAKSFASRDQQEVAGYAHAIAMIFDSFESLTLTQNHIKQLHGVLLKYSSQAQEHRGHYKKVPNQCRKPSHFG
jgi:hypothetical protein